MLFWSTYALKSLLFDGFFFTMNHPYQFHCLNFMCIVQILFIAFLIKVHLNFAFLTDKLELSVFTFGDHTPSIKYVRSFEYMDGVPGGRKPVSWTNINTPPTGLDKVSSYQLVCELDTQNLLDQFIITKLHWKVKSWNAICVYVRDGSRISVWGWGIDRIKTGWSTARTFFLGKICKKY